MQPRIRYGSNQRSHLDDDKFIVVAANAMTSMELKLLYTKLDGDRNEIEASLSEIHRSRREKGVYTDPAQVRNLRQTQQRRTQQLRWIQKRLDQQREIEAWKTPPEEKSQRKKDFNEAFFDIARKKLAPKDPKLFKEICEAAANASDDKWEADDNRL